MRRQTAAMLMWWATIAVAVASFTQWGDPCDNGALVVGFIAVGGLAGLATFCSLAVTRANAGASSIAIGVGVGGALLVASFYHWVDQCTA